MITVPGMLSTPRALPLRREDPFVLDPRVTAPASFRVAFVILLDGDLVMSPEHLGVAYMTAVLRRAGFATRIWAVAHGSENAAVQEIEAYAPRLACFTLMSLNVASCRLFVRALREKLPPTPIACGGPAATFAGATVLEQIPEVDIVASGEGETTILDIVQRLYLEEDLGSCAGIFFRGVDSVVHATPTRSPNHDLDALPFPARDQLEANGNRLEYVRVSTSRGCVARCTFCSAPNLGNRVQGGKAWRGRSPGSVVEELEHLVSTYGFRTFDFIDSTFEDPDGGRVGKARIARIAEGILERGLDIYYNCCMRAENWSESDGELLALLVRSGLEKVNIGIESGTESELRLWDKKATVEDNHRVLALMREHGVYVAMGFIQFHPYSTLETLRTNAAFLKQWGGHNLRRLTERLEIYPGTRIVERLEREGLLRPEFHSTLNHYDYLYQDQRVERIARHFASLYNNDDYHQRGVITRQSAVFTFETFNVVVETFISRTRRAFGSMAGVEDQLCAFEKELQRIRREMADFNHGLFLEVVEAVADDRYDPASRTRQVEEIEKRFTSCMDEVRTRQLRLGHGLLRAGVPLRRISSTLSTPSNGAPRTYTGGAPCW
ncbi:MAG TPA: radical SAM protein [Longimicrobiaceae bacterium]